MQQRRKLLQSRYDNISVERASAVLRESINASKTIEGPKNNNKEVAPLVLSIDNPVIEL
jgi:hypothetical protein